MQSNTGEILKSFPALRAGVPAVLLAPMEGVTDAPMRDFMTQLGGIHFCVSEFLRVSQEVIPEHVFLRDIPELRTSAKTPAGVSVQVQLLGGDPERLAQSALKACAQGAQAIDLNFGCPAPTVNRHDGGATLLKYPLRLRSIVETVRASVPKEIPVSAKMRLGWESIDDIDENAERVAEGGASWITIHGRTRVAGYRPPAYWEPIARVHKRLSPAGTPVVANGEIWCLDDFRRCRDITQSEHYMLGRGALANPLLIRQVAQELGIEIRAVFPFEQELFKIQRPTEIPVHAWVQWFQKFIATSTPYFDRPNRVLARVKQWTGFINTFDPVPWRPEILKCQTFEELLTALGALSPRR